MKKKEDMLGTGIKSDKNKMKNKFKDILVLILSQNKREIWIN